MGNATTKSHYSKSIPVGTNSRRSRWDGPGLPAPPGKPILIPGTNDAQPDVVAIRWERSPSNGGSAILGYFVEHRRLGSPYWVRSTPVLCAFPELTLSGLEPGWRYQFRVRAQNALGLSEPSEISDPLTVTLQRCVASAPHFELELKDTVALENEQAEFIVRFSGTPLPKISWFKDGFEIFSSRRTKIITENGKSVLLIHQTALNDEGEIKCTATNKVGHVSTKAKLVLEAPPKIRFPRQYEDGLLFEQDETIRLKVSLAGKPSPTVTWYHDGEMIFRDERHIFEEMEGESILKIPDAKRNDRGEYIVKATNKLGDDTSSFLVTVTDRPAAPEKVAVTMTLGRSVTLSWTEPVDDGGCKIGTYIVEYYRIGWDVWLKAITSRQTTVTLTELIENSEYKFRVKAENPYGVSDPSEESDIIFIADLKRGITTPPLSGKSQSHREINRSRAEKREVSFSIPAQRTRSLTREEGRARNEEDDMYSHSGERSASAQRLSIMTRPSRADSRVTFALDTITPMSKDYFPAEQDCHFENHLNAQLPYNEDANQEEESPLTTKPVTTVIISPPDADESRKRSIFRESKSRSLSVSREESSPPISENHTVSSHYLRPSTNLILKKQNAVINESTVSLPTNTSSDKGPNSPLSPREGDENALHGSSEFMLVLYPEDQNTKSEQSNNVNNRNLSGMRQSTMEETEDEEDLIPPPMSYSLPELFSEEHQVIETLRDAVSSTELLHERAMERFYKAVAAEEASELIKRKTQLERKTGELAATLKSENVKMGTPIDIEYEDTQNLPSSLLRRLSNSGMTTQNIINSWQTKKNRRRSSEGQAEVNYKTSVTLLPSHFLSDIEARSDPNLLKEPVTSIESWRRDNDEEAVERLRRWHETRVPLVEHEKQEETPELPENLTIHDITKKQTIIESQQISEQHQEDIEVEESIETSEESSEEISSADSEDLKLLKSRILARQVIDEEDTYHPKGKPTPHMESGPISAYEMAHLEISSSASPEFVTPVSPLNIMPKSILKKPKEEPNSLNSCDKPIPPKKPIRKMLPQYLQQPPQQLIDQPRREDMIVTRKESSTNMSETMKASVMSISDTNSILSAAEAAKNRRIHGKTRSMISTEEENEEADIEARMAVVNHYTEIVREHSSYSKVPEEKKVIEISRGSSISENHSEKHEAENNRKEENVIPTLLNKQNSRNVQGSKRTNKNDENQQGSQISTSRKNSISSVNAKITKEKRVSRPTSRNQSPASRSRNTSMERGISSRSSSKTRVRASSRERSTQSPTRVGPENCHYVREKSAERSRQSKISSRSSSKTPSRSNSRDRYRATTPTDMKMEKLHKALENRKYRPLLRNSAIERDYTEYFNGNDERLTVDAKKTVRSMVSYVTDLTLLLAAVYIYLFKKETLAVPFIALLLYRRIQQELFRRLSRNWWWRARKY